MREIEFRGKKKTPYGDKWVEGYYALLDGEHVIIMPHSTSYEEALKENRVIPTISVNHEIDINTLGQYTGLKDKNGKKIYEGDIVKTNRDVIAKVLWDNDYLGYFLHVNEENSIEDFENGEQPLYDYFEDIEVIGNIHDNPELLKEEL